MEIFNWSIFPLHWKISGWLPKHTPARGSPWPAGTYTNQFNTPMKCLSQVGRSLSSEFSNPSWLQYVPDIFNPTDICVGHTHIACWPCWALSGSAIFLNAVSYKCISALFHQIKSNHINSYHIISIHIPHQQLDPPCSPTSYTKTPWVFWRSPKKPTAPAHGLPAKRSQGKSTMRSMRSDHGESEGFY